MNPEELKLFPQEEPRYRIKETGEIVTFDWLKKIVLIYQERLKKLSELSQLTDFFFKDQLDYEKSLLRWNTMRDEEIKISLEYSEKILSKIKTEDFQKENLERILLFEAEKFAQSLKKPKDKGYLLWPLRVALTGKESSAGPFEIAEILGKEKTLRRIKEAKEKLK